MDKPALARAELAEGRARLYTILSRLVAGPVEPELMPYLPLFPHVYAAWQARTTADGGQAAQYEAILGHAVFPYASVFLVQDGLLGGPLTADVIAFYQAVGYGMRSQSGGDDHLANLLGCLAHLCAAESDAWADGLRHVAYQTCRLQSRLLQEFCLPWLAPLAVALQRTQDTFYGACAALLIEVIEDHWTSNQRQSEENGGAVSSPPMAGAPHLGGRIDLNSIPNLPDLGASHVAELADFFCSPWRAGLYLLPADLQRLGRRLGVAVGFGGRSQRVQTLLEVVPARELPCLLDQLSSWAAQWYTAYAELAQMYPTLQPWIDPWSRRVESTQRLLQTMRGQAQSQLSN